MLIIVGCIIMSAYFSATETAFSSLNRIRIKNMAEKGNKKADRRSDPLTAHERYGNKTNKYHFVVGGIRVWYQGHPSFTFIKGACGVIPSIFLLFYLVKTCLIIHLYTLCFSELHHHVVALALDISVL